MSLCCSLCPSCSQWTVPCPFVAPCTPPAHSGLFRVPLLLLAPLLLAVNCSMSLCCTVYPSCSQWTVPCSLHPSCSQWTVPCPSVAPCTPPARSGLFHVPLLYSVPLLLTVDCSVFFASLLLTVDCSVSLCCSLRPSCSQWTVPCPSVVPCAPSAGSGLFRVPLLYLASFLPIVDYSVSLCCTLHPSCPQWTVPYPSAVPCTPPACSGPFRIPLMYLAPLLPAVDRSVSLCCTSHPSCPQWTVPCPSAVPCTPPARSGPFRVVWTLSDWTPGGASLRSDRCGLVIRVWMATCGQYSLHFTASNAVSNATRKLRVTVYTPGQSSFLVHPNLTKIQ